MFKSYTPGCRKINAIIYLMSACIISCVQANDNPYYVNLSYSEVDLSNNQYDPPSDIDNGFILGFGIAVNEHLAIEANYHDMGSQSGISRTATEREFDYEADGFSLSVLGRYEVDQFFMYAKVGALNSTVDGVYRHLQNTLIEASGTAAIYGAGLGYAVNEHLSYTLDYLQSEIGGSFEEVDTLSVGIKLSF